jgi:hypothetical protein
MVLLGTIMATGSDALSSDRFGHHWRAPHFVPNSQRFWDNS